LTVNRPKFRHIAEPSAAEGAILFQLAISHLGGEGSTSGANPGKTTAWQSPVATILFIPLSLAQNNLEADWAEMSAQVILRRCPICLQDSIVGHGRRSKQAHDQDHDRIGIRRGRCSLCEKTFTFLLWLS
jgi:hypothetical protein